MCVTSIIAKTKLTIKSLFESALVTKIYFANWFLIFMVTVTHLSKYIETNISLSSSLNSIEPSQSLLLPSLIDSKIHSR